MKQNPTQASKHTAGEAGTLTHLMKKVCFISPSKDNSVTVRNYLLSLFTEESDIITHCGFLHMLDYFSLRLQSLCFFSGGKKEKNADYIWPNRINIYIYYIFAQVPALTCHPEFLWSPSNTENRIVLLDSKVC